jgi:hypothetical protein
MSLIVPKASRLSASLQIITVLSGMFLLSAPSAFAQAGAPQAAAAPAGAFTWYGDLRLRYEVDWDSHTAAGAKRIDRSRGRGRARAGFGYAFSEQWSIGGRLRTGDAGSQQSSHLTFAANDNVTDDIEIVPDRYFVQFKDGHFTGWAGRNTTPFWQQNEMFWDEDVTPTGISGSYEAQLPNAKLITTAGAFYLPDGATRLNGRMIAGQLRYVRSFGRAQLTTAAGLHLIQGHRGAKYLRNRNGERDYTIGVLNAQWSQPVAGQPLVLGADLFNNFENYSAAEVAPFAAQHADETLGYVVSAQWGQLKKAADWQVGYFYGHIETLAVNASYAQDDWARFGSATQSDLSDIKGHELRAAYAVNPKINFMVRAFFAEAITTIQDGSRVRADLNYKF